MGYFLQKFGITLNEAEADGQDQGTDDTNTDYSAAEDTGNDNADTNDQQTDNTEDTENTDTNEENNDTTNDTNTDDNTDYTEEDDGMDGDDMGDGDNGGGDNNGGNDEDQPVDDLKKQEEDIYSSANLTPEQLDIKHKELKKNYLDMYDVTSGLIDRISDIGVNTDNVKVVEYVSDQLTKLRTMVSDYVNNVYAGKSYIENAINYNRFLAVLHGINKMLEELSKTSNN